MIIRSHTRSPRRGLSLLEVLVALAIFLFSIVALHQALNIGTSNAVDMQQHIQAAQLAQSKLAEVYVGAVPLTSQSDTPFDEDPDYTWSLDAEQNGVAANLWNVTVTVTRARGDGSKLETKVSQMIIDPSIRGTSYDAAATATISPPSSTGGGSGSSGSGSSGSGNSAAAAGGAAAAPTGGAGGTAAKGAAGTAGKGTTGGNNTGKAATGGATGGGMGGGAGGAGGGGNGGGNGGGKAGGTGGGKGGGKGG